MADQKAEIASLKENNNNNNNIDNNGDTEDSQAEIANLKK